MSSIHTTLYPLDLYIYNPISSSKPHTRNLNQAAAASLLAVCGLENQRDAFVATLVQFTSLHSHAVLPSSLVCEAA